MRGRLFFLLGVFLLFFGSSFVVGAELVLSTPSVCCERTTQGAWCINDDKDNCDSSYLSAPTACESSSFCKLGTCYDSSEGVCFSNTPQRVCDDNGGTWDPREIEEVPQCQLGCCVLADQASFVPLVRCKKLSTYFGVSVDYRTDVQDEMSCIMIANSQDMGACVYEKEFERVCEFTTRGECGAEESVDFVGFLDEGSSARAFYKDYLCSAEELNSVCARQVTTSCYQGKVYWYDSCGNRENVYFEDRDLSWNNGKFTEPENICDANDGTDFSCGNCDYMLGSRCEETQGLLGGERAFCQRTECVDRWGDSRLNGESWCVNDGLSGQGRDKVGSRYYREVCIDGEIRVEPCADFRNEVCYESSIDTSAGEYSVGACRVNRWQECIGITDENLCVNGDKRDCIWLESPLGLLIGGSGGGSGTSGFSNPTGGSSAAGVTSSSPSFVNPFSGSGSPITGQAIFGDDERSEDEITSTNRADGVCVPQYSPGLQFWDDGSAAAICGLVNSNCVVEYKKGLLGDWECSDNCECLGEGWASDLNRICAAQGDCGAYINYVGRFTDSGYEWLTSTERKEFSSVGEGFIKSGFTGNVIGSGEGTLNKALLESEGGV